MICKISTGQVVAGNTDLKVLVKGLTNKVEVSCEGVKRKRLVVYCPDFNFKDSIGFIFIKIPYEYDGVRTTKLYFKDKRSKNKKWTDSVEFRIKRLPEIITQLGSLTPGAYSFGEITLQHSLYAYIENFWVQDITIKIVSYHFHLRDFNNLMFLSQKVSGNSTEYTGRLKGYASAGTEVVFDSISASLNGRIFNLTPVKYTVKGEIENKRSSIILFSNSSETILYHPSFDGHLDFNLYPIKRQVYISGRDTVKLAEQIDSSGKLILFRRYYDNIPDFLKTESKRISDTSFFVKYYNRMGTCIAEGCSFDPLINVSVDSNHERPALRLPEDSLRNWCEKNKVTPFGLWRFYHPNGNLYAEGKFNVRKLRKLREGEFIMCDDALPFNYYGIWKIYDLKGVIIREENFELKY